MSAEVESVVATVSTNVVVLATVTLSETQQAATTASVSVSAILDLEP